MSGKNLPKYTKLEVTLSTKPLILYAGQKVAAALHEVNILDKTIYEGVRLGQVMEAVYEQGLKDGRREVIEKIDAIKGQTNYLPPGRPKRSSRARKAIN